MKAGYFETSEGTWNAWLGRFTTEIPGVTWQEFQPEDMHNDAMKDLEVLILSNRLCSPEMGAALKRAKKLRWVHFFSSGYDQAIVMGMPEGVIASNASSVKGSNISEHVLTLILALKRQLPELSRLQKAHIYNQRQVVREKMVSLEGGTLCIVGLGAIGRAVARKATALGAHVIAVSREAEPDETIKKIYPRAALHEALKIADAVALCTSADSSTHHIIGAAELGVMKNTAVLVNIARGELIDEPALIAALKEKRIAGAGLDVTETEPLPESSPLWDLENVILTPHIANAGADQYKPHRDLFTENLKRLQAGVPLLNPCKF